MKKTHYEKLLYYHIQRENGANSEDLSDPALHYWVLEIGAFAAMGKTLWLE